MQYPSRSGVFSESTDSADAFRDPLSAKDVVFLLQLMGSVVSLRNDPRTWRHELLVGINQAVGTTIAVALTLKNLRTDRAEPPSRAASPPAATADAGNPLVVSLFEVGFKIASQRNAFLQEFNTAPFRDPFFRAAVERLVSGNQQTFTALRSDLIDDRTWQSDPNRLSSRRGKGTGDCAISLQKSADPGTAYALYVFLSPQTESSSGDSPKTTSPLGPRERVLLDTLHRGLMWLYRDEESTHRLTRATGLPPRLRQTLTFLLAGDTERQVALKMSLSVHTVHDYVKALYSHFGVSSRSALLAKWMQTSGPLPKRTDF